MKKYSVYTETKDTGMTADSKYVVDAWESQQSSPINWVRRGGGIFT